MPTEHPPIWPPPRPTAPALRSVLAITDLHHESDAMLMCASQLAGHHRIALHIAYHGHRPRHPYADPIARLLQRARHIRRQREIEVNLLAHRPLGTRELAEMARLFDLVCIHRQLCMASGSVFRPPLWRLLLDKGGPRTLVLDEGA